eukprot:11986235-Alexandrium_andersonii.AAC.1
MRPDERFGRARTPGLSQARVPETQHVRPGPSATPPPQPSAGRASHQAEEHDPWAEPTQPAQ